MVNDLSADATDDLMFNANSVSDIFELN